MEVKAGYKQTEVGVIPDDWEVRTLNSLGKRGRPAIKAGPFGSSLTKDTYVSEGYKVYGQEQVIRGDYLYGDYFISREHFNELKSCEVVPGDILLSLVGTAGRILVIPDGAPEGIINPRLIRFSFDQNIISSSFFKFLFGAETYQALLSRNAQGGTMGVLNASLLKPICIPLPSLTEQEAIAEALSDADALIEAVEQLLAKKRQIKQGAIQELLTGKKRLFGFEKKSGYKQTEVGIIPEDWDAVSILEICDDKKGSIKIGPFGSQLKREYLVSSGYKVYGQENVYSQDVEIGDRFLTQEHFLKLKSCELLPGDFIVSMMGTIGQCMIVPGGIQQGIIDSHLIRIRLNPKVVVPRYMSYYYSSKLVFDQISRLQVGGIMAGLSSSVIKQIYIGLPNTTKEQTAIAEILSDMDAEISALEEKLVRVRQVKAGMMSVLLTGKIRLV